MAGIFHIKGVSVDINRFAELLGKQSIKRYVECSLTDPLEISGDDLDPDALAECVINGNLKQEGLGLETVKGEVLKAMIRDPELTLVYQRAFLPEAGETDIEIPLVEFKQVFNFDLPGETWTINLGQAACPNGRIHSIDPYGNDEYVSAYGFFQPKTEGASMALEITHVQGANGEPYLDIPVHMEVQDEDGSTKLRLSVLRFKLKLPPSQEREDVFRLSVDLTSKKPAIVDLEPFGLIASEKTFCTTQMMVNGPFRNMYTGPREIADLVIKPLEHGKRLEIYPTFVRAIPKDIDSKTIWTHLFKNDRFIPVELTVNFH